MKAKKTLLEENLELKRKLKIASEWMKKEVKQDSKKIAKSKITNSTLKEKTCFLNDNIEEIVSDKIQDFFGELMLINIPAKIIRNIISAEINYYNFRNNPNFDGFSVISSYHKALDIIIENYITSDFRTFARKNIDLKTRYTDSLDKSIFLIIENNYSLSAWRLFHIIKNIKEKENINWKYEKLFNQYLEKFNYIKNILLEDNFYKLFEKIIQTEVLWEKRHSGQISFVETREARKILIWDFKDKNCIIYELMMIWEV